MSDLAVYLLGFAQLHVSITDLSKHSVVTALRARRALADQGVIGNESELDIVDTPYISDLPDGLRDIMSSGRYENVLFCDICKEGPGSNTLSSTIMGLKKEGILPDKWDFVAAPRTYNPLGNVVTFLNEEDIIGAYKNMLSGDDQKQSRVDDMSWIA